MRPELLRDPTYLLSSPSQRYLSFFDKGRWQVFDLRSSTLKIPQHFEDGWFMSWIPGPDRIVCASTGKQRNATVGVYNPATGERRRFLLRGKEIVGLASVGAHEVALVTSPSARKKGSKSLVLLDLQKGTVKTVTRVLPSSWQLGEIR